MKLPDLAASYRFALRELVWWRKYAADLERINLKLIARSREHARETAQELERLVRLRQRHQSLSSQENPTKPDLVDDQG